MLFGGLFGGGSARTRGHDMSYSTVPVLLEIVGAIGLPAKGTTANDGVNPQCVVFINDIAHKQRNGHVKWKQVHRTREIKDDVNPIWTIKTHSLAILDIPDKFHKDDEEPQVLFEVRTSGKCIGKLHMTYDTFLHGKGQRVQYEVPSELPGYKRCCFLHLRYRPATPDDIRFMREVMNGDFGAPEDLTEMNTIVVNEKNSKTNGKKQETPEAARQIRQMEKHKPGQGKVYLASDVNFHAVRPATFFIQQFKFTKSGKKAIRVAPFPDPERPEETTFMTKEDIETEVMKPSKEWVSAGSGTLGTLFLEILKCDDLPNLDLGLGDLSDPFVGIVYEDTMVRTNVMWDNLNPRWLPWTTRAFAFKIRHPDSSVRLGVFDYDEVPVDFHDPIGRVPINLANFRPDTEYLLHYKLHHDAREEDDRGTITIRLRLHYNDVKKVIKVKNTIPPRFIVNVDNPKSLAVLRYLTRGAIDMEDSNLKSVKLYINELASYWRAYCYALDVFLEVVLWRGTIVLDQFPQWGEIWFPFHSVVLFMAVTLFVEFPNQVVAILLFSMAYVLLCIYYNKSIHPHPWRCVVAFSPQALYEPETIEPYEGLHEGEVLDKLDRLKGERMSNLLYANYTFMYRVYRIYTKTANSGFAITTETRRRFNFWSNFISNQLHYLHMALKYMCKYTRLFRSFVNWRSPTTGALVNQCLLIGALFVIAPMNTIVLWAIRILSWSLTGPWMKLLDEYWVKKWYKTKKQMLADIENGTESPIQVPDFDAWLETEFFQNLNRRGRETAEFNYKLRDMRERVFGEYSDEIPFADSSRFMHIPLPSSTAKPVAPDLDYKYAYHVPGQRLEGDIIFFREDHIKVDATDTAELNGDKKTN